MTPEEKRAQNNHSLKILTALIESGLALGFFKDFATLDAARAALLDLHKAVNPDPTT